MNEFVISLAGIPISIIPLCPTVPCFFSDYICNDPPLFCVATTEKEIEQERLRDETGEEYILSPLTDRNLEILILLRKIAARLIVYDTIVFHGSVVALNGKAYLFTAPSGTGKTTHTRLWLEQLPEAYVLNGDKPFLKATTGEKVLACGGPWRGKEKYGCNETLPLEAICLLERSAENHIEAISPREAMNTLIRQSNIPEGPNAMIQALQIIDRISRNVRLYRLGCNMNPEAAQISIRAMIPEKAGGEMRGTKDDI